jgi:glycosyltransferase involved in cell wall biosynthesis
MELYANSHFFLHPSETPPDQNQEGIPNSILEAMSTGLSVLATRHGGIPEAVEHGRSGLLVEERDFVALAASMKEIVRSPFAFREMGALASESVAANFEQREQIRQLETHYDEAVALAGAEERVSRPAPAIIKERFAEQVPVK